MWANKNTVVKFRVCIGDYATQLRGDCDQYHEIRIPITIEQPVFSWKVYIRGFLSWLNWLWEWFANPLEYENGMGPVYDGKGFPLLVPGSSCELSRWYKYLSRWYFPRILVTIGSKLNFLLKQNQKRIRQGILVFFSWKKSGWKCPKSPKLDGSFNPFEKYHLVKLDPFPQKKRVKLQKNVKPPTWQQNVTKWEAMFQGAYFFFVSGVVILSIQQLETSILIERIAGKPFRKSLANLKFSTHQLTPISFPSPKKTQKNTKTCTFCLESCQAQPLRYFPKPR